MDVLAHTLWSRAVFHQAKFNPWWAGLVGVMPDLVSFGPYFITEFLFHASGNGRPGPGYVFPRYIVESYHYSHSLVIWVVAFLLIWAIRYWFSQLRSWRVHPAPVLPSQNRGWASLPVLLFAWGLHIAIDIPTHSRAFFPTPFLWPLSDFTVNGISWGEPWFLGLNYGALIAVFGWLYWRKRVRL